MNSEEYKLAPKVLLRFNLYILNYSFFVFNSCLQASLAGVEGFEPSQAVLETDVLPLTLYP